MVSAAAAAAGVDNVTSSEGIVAGIWNVVCSWSVLVRYASQPSST